MRKRHRDRVLRRRNPILHLESLESRQLLSGFGSLLPLPRLPDDLAGLVGPDRLQPLGVSPPATGPAGAATAAASVTPAGVIDVALNVSADFPLPLSVPAGTKLLSLKLAASVDLNPASGDGGPPGPAELIPDLGLTVQVAVGTAATDVTLQAAACGGSAGGGAVASVTSPGSSDGGLIVGVDAGGVPGLPVTANASVNNVGAPGASDAGTGLSVGLGAGVTAGQGGTVGVALNVDVGTGDQSPVLPPGGGSSGGSGSQGGGPGGGVGLVINLPGFTSGAGAGAGTGGVPTGAGGGAVLTLDDGSPAPGQVAVVSTDGGPRNGVVTGEFEVPAGRQNDILPVAGPLQPVPGSAGPLNDPLQAGPAVPTGGSGGQEGTVPVTVPVTAPAAGAGTAAEVDSDQGPAELASRQALDGFQPASLAPLADFFPAVVDALENMASQSLDRMLELGDGGGLGVVTCVLALSAGAVAFEAGSRHLRSGKLAPVGAVLWTGYGLV
jgi:hypothetical protein